MADFGGEIKGKSRLAVFEHVVEKDKRVSKRKRRYSDDSSQSESELVIFDLPVPKKKTGVNLKDEVLNLVCEWGTCNQNFQNFEEYLVHIIGHSKEELDLFDCQWHNCPNPEVSSLSNLVRHLSYHGYIRKLQNIGDNIAKRDNLPDCVLKEDYKIKVSDYTCQWDDCNTWFGCINDFLCHVLSHVQGVPSKSNKCDISCEWIGCSAKVSSRYKLGEHMKVHTKERLIACSKCGAMFVNKLTFSDHRKRQLKSNLRRYQCSQCLKLFPTEKILSDHMRSHINQYKCTLCDMTSAKPSELAKHYRYRHINDRPFKCHLCIKDFVAKCNLNAHLLTHQKDPFKCSLCGKGFKSKVGLNSHMEKAHNKAATKYQCHVCKVYMNRGDAMTKHLMKKHKFHWPSGHSRFRYRKDQDGVCRLQTVRYESLEVTEEMIKSESIQKQTKPNTAFTYHISHADALKDGYKVTVVEEGGGRSERNFAEISTSQEKPQIQPEPHSDAEILITFEDVDDQGQVINSQILKSALVVQPGPDKGSRTPKKRKLNEGCDKIGKSNGKNDENPRNEEKSKKTLSAVEINPETFDGGDGEDSSLTGSENVFSELSQGSVIATCDNEEIQVLKPVEFVNVKSEIF